LRDRGAKPLKGAWRALWCRNAVTKGLRDSVPELLERASEKLAARLELRAETQESEGVVTRDIEPAAELVEKEVEAGAPLRGKRAQPLVHPRTRVRIH
jgi:hypothetical protein